MNPENLTDNELIAELINHSPDAYAREAAARLDAVLMRVDALRRKYGEREEADYWDLLEDLNDFPTIPAPDPLAYSWYGKTQADKVQEGQP